MYQPKFEAANCALKAHSVKYKFVLQELLARSQKSEVMKPHLENILQLPVSPLTPNKYHLPGVENSEMHHDAILKVQEYLIESGFKHHLPSAIEQYKLDYNALTISPNYSTLLDNSCVTSTMVDINIGNTADYLCYHIKNTEVSSDFIPRLLDLCEHSEFLTYISMESDICLIVGPLMFLKVGHTLLTDGNFIKVLKKTQAYISHPFPYADSSSPVSSRSPAPKMNLSNSTLGLDHPGSLGLRSYVTFNNVRFVTALTAPLLAVSYMFKEPLTIFFQSFMQKISLISWSR